LILDIRLALKYILIQSINSKKVSLLLMALFYIGAGINHFLNPAMYLKIMPPYLPQPLLLVYISGLLEIILGCLLLPAKTRRFAAGGIILLLLAIFPANVQMVLNYYQAQHPGWWIALVRLPLQGALIWWAWSFIRR
jgi:uncharacterized membrane protein